MEFFHSYRLVSTIFIFGSLLGCTIGIPRPIPSEVPKIVSSRIVKKNYSIGKPLKAYVGDPMVRVKDYYLDEIQTQVATVNTNAIASGWSIGVNLEKGRQYRVVGTWNLNGKQYTVVETLFNSNTANKAGLLIREDGSIADRLLIMVANSNYKAIVANEKISVSPAGTRLIRKKTSKVNSQRGGYINFELIFTGITGQSINVLYREYSPEDLARPAFYQNLTYDRNANTIRFKGLRIKLHSVDNERVEYTVEGDVAP